MSMEHMCPKYEKAMSILGRRWTGLVIRALLAGQRRFGEIAIYIDGISDRLLSERLKELEAVGIVEKLVYPETPVRIEYALTPKGLGFQKVVEAIQIWADKWESVDEGSEIATGRASEAAS
jgi:DNA-binding HxlR family transcriptional regulator